MRVLLAFALWGLALVAARLLAGTGPLAAGAVLVTASGLVLLLNLLRSLAGTSRTGVARRAGLGGLPLGLLFFGALGGALGSADWRKRAAEVAERRAAEDRRIEAEVAKAPLVTPLLDEAERQLGAGHVEECAAQLRKAEQHLKLLRPYEARAPLIPVLARRFGALTTQWAVALEARALRSAEEAQSLPGPAGLEAGVRAGGELQRLPARSPAASERLTQLRQHLAVETKKTGALLQPLTVLRAKYFAAGGVLEAGESTTADMALGLDGAKGLATTAGGKCTGLYLVASERPGALSETAAGDFVELAVGPHAEKLSWKAPRGSGARATTRTINGVVLHEGWFDERLVELWVGDFKP